METNTVIALIIEAVVTLTPVVTLFFRLGQWKRNVEKDIEGVSLDVVRTKAETDELRDLFQQMNNTLIELNVKVGLLLQNKLKVNNSEE